MFGTFPGADGATFGWDDGVRRPLTHLTEQRVPDIPHCWLCANADWNHGKMDGFNQSDPADKYAYTQLWKADEPNYWAWAKPLRAGRPLLLGRARPVVREPPVHDLGPVGRRARQPLAGEGARLADVGL